MRSVLVGLVAAVLCAGSAMADAAWQTYRYPELGFSVDLPSAPTRQDATSPIPPNHTIAISGFTVALGTTGALYVGTTDYGGLGLTSAQWADPAVQNKVLEGGVQGSVTNSNSDLVSESTITVDGAPARDYRFKSKDGSSVGRAWMVLRGTRGYIVVGAGTAAGGEPPEFNRVSQSLRLSDVK